MFISGNPAGLKLQNLNLLKELKRLLMIMIPGLSKVITGVPFIPGLTLLIP